MLPVEQDGPEYFRSYTKDAVRAAAMSLFALGIAISDKVFIEENSPFDILFVAAFIIIVADAIHAGVNLMRFDDRG